jgi:hypothetical protein
LEFYKKLFDMAGIIAATKLKIYCYKEIIWLNSQLYKKESHWINWIKSFYQFNLELETMLWYFDSNLIQLTLIHF